MRDCTLRKQNCQAVFLPYKFPKLHCYKQRKGNCDCINFVMLIDTVLPKRFDYIYNRDLLQVYELAFLDICN